ncbi:MAG TPA: tripartite tricarboxylate transporter substrate binding protein [Burkholderiales bacterium]|nr:tripartite tricarboxylate transporter substrate binding protein [Burkholderiales bacterium]
MTFTLLRLFAVNLLFWLSLAATAQAYPARAVTLVVPYPLSGPTDIRGASRMTKTYKLMSAHAPPSISDTLSRIVQQAIRYESKHPVLLERQPGGATTRGAQHVARAAADGHTLLLGSNETMVLTPHYAADVGYDPTRNFELVAPLVNMPFILMTRSGLPFRTLDRLIAYVKVRPGEINYGSSGDGSTGHLAGELLRRAAGLDMVHVSYNGGLAALNGLATGQISAMFAALPLALPYINNEHLRVLAVSSPRRTELLPDLPTLAESGIRGADVAAWFGVFVPNGVAPGIIRWLSDHIGESVNEASTRNILIALGLEPVRGPLSAFATRIYAEGERWGPLLRAARIPARNAS